jgi:uncharacterized protein YciI
MYYLLLYEVVDDYPARRAPLREAHLRLARQAVERGELVLAGAFEDPVDGAALVFRAADAAVVEDFVSKDPYVTAGLVTRWRLRRWNVVVGSQLDQGISRR